MTSDEELLAAYLDGVGELTPDERRRFEARLADEPELRADAEATRGLLDQLRELPPEGNEPDWSLLERAIRDEVGGTAPRPWWRGWRWLVPVGALAMAGAVLALVLRTPQPVAVFAVPDAGVTTVVPVTDDSLALWLDGEHVDVDLEAADDFIDDEILFDDEPDPDLLTAGDLAWIDELGDDDVAAAEAWLARKKS
ncbi:MAG: hypothetical protein H0T46_13655 [Deltaproteobacteria bacterium]|nr:hypothetical protein [Deltaproteobacteria bacterium]